jgi:small-conductance mechanosensitive channel
MEGILNTILGVGTVYAQGTTAAKSESPDMVTFILSNLPLWITAAIILVASIIIAFIVKKTVENRLAANVTEEHQEVLLLSGRVSFVTVAVLGITIALAVAGIDLTSVVAALAFGISFGLQDTIANFVAGLGILASKPFTIGDWINVEGKTGRVENIKTRVTYLRTYDGLRLIVPNATLYKGNVLSYTSNPLRRMKVPVYPRYECDMKEVVKICLNVVKANPRIYLEPKPSVVFVDWGDYYVELQVRFWVDAKGGLWRKIQSKVMAEIQQKLEESGMDSPYPVTNLSFIEDGESYVVKTKAVDSGEYEKMKVDRAVMNEEYAKRRAEILKWQIAAIQQEVPADTSGIAFLKTETKPAAAPTSQVPQQAVPDETSGMAFLKTEAQPVIIQADQVPQQVMAQPPANQDPLSPNQTQAPVDQTPQPAVQTQAGPPMQV